MKMKYNVLNKLPGSTLDVTACWFPVCLIFLLGKDDERNDMKIFGRDWSDIEKAQHKFPLDKPVKPLDGKDYGCDPIGDGTFKMVPSGDIVDFEERNRRLIILD